MKIIMIKLLAAFALTVASWSSLAGTAAEQVNVVDPWAREVPPVVSTSAGFMGLENNGNKEHKIVAASSPAAGMVELHTHINENGVMRMRPVENITVPAGGKAMLQPGGLHLMLMMLKEPLKAGETMDITLEFEDGSKKEIKAEVRKFDMKNKPQHMH